MEFLIADTFTSSLARLTGDEQKAVKTTAFDLQMNPVNTGMQLHRIDRAKDKNFWSARVSQDIRIIVHKTDQSFMLCYVDHHDKAYQWAERRKVETHPKTGAAQLVEVRERVEEIFIPKYVEQEIPKPPRVPLFKDISEETLLGFGVPREWLADVKSATEDSVLAVADHLPREAAEAVLELATGGTPARPAPAAPGSDPFLHPDAQRRFRVMQNVEELERALEFPWDKWTIFLHPAQRDMVERKNGGPARVSGSAGTGKTIVALHRAVHLGRANPDSRVLLTTFSEILANALRTRLRRLVSNEPRIGERIEVQTLDAMAERLFKPHAAGLAVASSDVVAKLVADTSKAVGGHKFSHNFLRTEWNDVVDAWQLKSWDDYRDVRRIGRKTRLPEPQRKVLWSMFERVRERLAAKRMITRAERYARLTEIVKASAHPPFDFVVVDEAQDVSIPQLKFLAALGGNRPDALFFAGDLGQRIFQHPFSWVALGVDVRGRSRNLTVNYRTSHQIRSQADRLLGDVEQDVDGITEDRNRTVSVFNGPVPIIETFDTEEAETAAVASWIRDRLGEGMDPHEIGLFVRSEKELARASSAAKASGAPYKTLDENVEAVSGKIAIGTMHLAKGLEFRAVAVMACDEDVIPSSERMATAGDETDLEEFYRTERHLLYVACTRARDSLSITAKSPGSEFLADLKAK